MEVIVSSSGRLPPPSSGAPCCSRRGDDRTDAVPAISSFQCSAAITRAPCEVTPASSCLLSSPLGAFIPACCQHFFISTSRGSSVSIVSDFRLNDRGSIAGRGKAFLLYPLSPDKLWGPPSLQSKGYHRTLPGLNHGQGVTLTTHP
jgi:hypothetical protein